MQLAWMLQICLGSLFRSTEKKQDLAGIRATGKTNPRNVDTSCCNLSVKLTYLRKTGGAAQLLHIQSILPLKDIQMERPLSRCKIEHVWQG
jgi:hypothetical protein